jgi:hypothetical protein
LAVTGTPFAVADVAFCPGVDALFPPVPPAVVVFCPAVDAPPVPEGVVGACAFPNGFAIPTRNDNEHRPATLTTTIVLERRRGRGIDRIQCIGESPPNSVLLSIMRMCSV